VPGHSLKLCRFVQEMSLDPLGDLAAGSLGGNAINAIRDGGLGKPFPQPPWDRVRAMFICVAVGTEGRPQ
jgi:hypothetical protein